MQVIFIETALNIRRFVLRDRKSIRSISRDTELSRNKIRKYLNDVSPPCYKPQGGAYAAQVYRK
ncbi:MAG TPA: hypothetical protein ENJ55_05095 [Rhizobiales bacterium]|nr:hypothetical protein [Hyphomicrobiales bacterium]